jgi:type IV secretory pathway TrbD component
LYRTLKAGVLYFAIVFSAGFILGTIRILWIVPRLGARAAELLESPFMVVISFAAARTIIRRMAFSFVIPQRLTMGAIAVTLMLVAEFTAVLWLRGLTLAQYLATRDPVSGSVYYFALFLFAIAPALVARRITAP